MKVAPLIRHAKIVGNYFRPKEAKDVFNALTEGAPLVLELEAGNQHDPFAVKILAGGTHIGYVPKEISGVLHICGVDDLVAIAHGKGEFSVGMVSEDVDHG